MDRLSPTGLPDTDVCPHCGEPILPDDVRSQSVRVINGSALIHVECLLRLVVGSVGHQLGRCSCFGGSEEDPPGLTAREAAREALALFRRREAMKN